MVYSTCDTGAMLVFRGHPIPETAGFPLFLVRVPRVSVAAAIQVSAAVIISVSFVVVFQLRMVMLL